MSPKLRFILTLVLIPLTCLLCCQACSQSKEKAPKKMSSGEKATLLNLNVFDIVLAEALDKYRQLLPVYQELPKLEAWAELQELLKLLKKPQALLRFALAEDLSQHLVEQPAVLKSYSARIGPWVIARYELPPQKPLEGTAGLYPPDRRNIAIVDTDRRRVIELGDWDSVLELFWLIIDDMQGRAKPARDHEFALFAIATGLTQGHDIYLPKTSLYPGPRLILNEDGTALIQYAFSPREDNAVATTLYTLTLTRKSISLSTETIVFL